MNNRRISDDNVRTGLCIMGGFNLFAGLYQNIVLQRPYFYALFSLGMFFLLLALYILVTGERLFANWTVKDAVFFTALLLLVCYLIDMLGMNLGYWEYPHYGPGDDLRKYFLEWGIALLYHMVSLQVGIKLFQRLFSNEKSAFFLSLVLIVTPVGFLTEALNLQVNSWRVVSMPFSNFKIGDYFLIFQTIGYWLMALIPYTLYLIVEQTVRRRETVKEKR